MLGDYRVVGRIGAGGMGAVYAGVRSDGLCAAVKVIHPQFAANPDFLARFTREVELVSRVRATCTAAFHGADTQADTPWMATEYVPGQTLRQHVGEHGPLSGGMLTALAAGLAEALAAIHHESIVHRDLKPGNVILSPTGPKVLDFGIARAVEETGLTRTGGLIGTPGWISPEQYQGHGATDRSDMFAWGGMVAFAATGRNPFGTGAPDVLAYRTRNEEPDLEGVPDTLLGLVRRALDKDPERRPSAAQALAALTDDWNTTRLQPAVAQPPTRVLSDLIAIEWRGVTAPAPRRVRRFRQVGRLPLLAGSAALLVLVLLAAWFLARPGTQGSDVLLEEVTGDADPVTSRDGSGDPSTLAVSTTPEDGFAVMAQAYELAMAAESFEAFEQALTSEIASFIEYAYTENPQPILSTRSYADGTLQTAIGVGEGPDDVIHGFGTLGEDGYSQQYYRDADAPLAHQRNAERDSLLGILDQVVRTAETIDHHGRATVPLVSDNLGNHSGNPDIEDREGHHYTGVFTMDRVGYDVEAEQPAVIATPEVSFDLWIDADGYPLYMQYFVAYETEYEGTPISISTSYELIFEHFNQPVEIELPEEWEIGEPPPGF
ncbi:MULTISPECIES: serine/threonine protein kinase [unclassified Nocardiopsis]|uniref:serine/threonine protein kinase n=1 Tax=Nocardiopsis TaxID=2013 RepID=UPI00387B3501